MIIKSRYKIKTESDLLFAKIDISNFLKKTKLEYISFFTFALMELGTNILKYAKSGEIWLLEVDNDYLLAALDEGGGIKNLDWAMKKGTSTKNSLGLGLYQLSNNSFFNISIFTSKKDPQGSVILIKPKNLNKDLIVLTQNYMDLDVSGDFFAKKGRYFILGDASGHGIKANKSAEFIKKYFLNNVISCLFIDDFFKNLHQKLKDNHLRSAVISVGEINKNKFNICGVGDINLISKIDNKIEKKSFKEGIIGEAFSSSSKYSYNFSKNSNFFVFSDGIDEKMIYNITKQIDDIYLIVVCAIFYSKKIDDKIILAIRT